MSEEFRIDYPFKQDGFFKCLGGFDLYRSAKVISAIVVVESQGGARDLRWYRWIQRTGKDGQPVMKVDLARFSVRRLNFKDLAEKVQKLREKFNIPEA